MKQNQTEIVFVIGIGVGLSCLATAQELSAT